MLFRKRSKSRPPKAVEFPGRPVRPTYPVDFSMMRKGAIIQRGNTKVRQFAVMLRGSVRLVTSGDLVDEDTWQALLAAEAVEAPAAAPEEQPMEQPAEAEERATEERS